MLNEDYKEMLQYLVDEDVKFLLMGAYALAAHGYPRATRTRLHLRACDCIHRRYDLR